MPGSTYGDWDDKPGHSSKRKIRRWADGEFATFTGNLIRSAQKFWGGKFCLKTPRSYSGLNYPDTAPTHRCNLDCQFNLEAARNSNDAHYTIAAVRVEDGETFRSDAQHYTQNDIKSEQMIPHSTAKFWTHYHEIGHLIGLPHVGHRGIRSYSGEPAAYGVSGREMRDVMGMGSAVNYWHAKPWQEAAAAFTGVRWHHWDVHKHIVPPQRL